ncbi:cupin domain-containing protein [Nocardia sp. NBC_00565]|uniref:cupin domain-containing protein n=1 Tax=Nocardia sp. NBC_00565 TaxID=2975993 RepID=UPI002E82315B|nr:cupin domain-containing protein [Nocardia sp. NBC_00565]WUC00305.1 cupin domain-containing protein [Nocardia sp. NBC_00565]
MAEVTKSARVVAAAEMAEVVGPQQQHLIPCVTRETCGSEGISAAMVNMVPGKVALAHYHAHSETVVVCLSGRAVTLIGPDLVPYEHGPGEFLYIPEGVVHVAVNHSATESLVALDIRTDPQFSADLVLTPEYDAPAAEVAARLWRDNASVRA